MVSGLSRAGEEGLPLFVRSSLTPGTSGDWTLEHFEIGPPNLPPDGKDPRPPWARNEPGTYTALRVGPLVMMSDTYDEWWTQKDAMIKACQVGGHILITGLGIGMVVDSMLQTPGSKVERITVVEASEDVISLVGPQILSRYPEQLEIVHHDAFTWRPPAHSRFTIGWHDIWPSPFTASNAEEIERLRRHYDPFCDWQGFWGEDMVLPE